MGVRDRFRRVEKLFFVRLEAGESGHDKPALVSWILFLVASLANFFLAAVTGYWVYLLGGGLFLLASGLGIRLAPTPQPLGFRSPVAADLITFLVQS